MKISIVHIYVCGMMKKKQKHREIIHISEIYPIVNFHIRIPRKYKKQFIKELVDYGLLKKLNRDNYQIQNIHLKKSLCDSFGNPLW